MYARSAAELDTSPNEPNSFSTCSITIGPPRAYSSGATTGSRTPHHASTAAMYASSYVRSAAVSLMRYAGSPPNSHSPHMYGPARSSTSRPSSAASVTNSVRFASPPNSNLPRARSWKFHGT